MRIFFTILQQELILATRNLGKILANILFFIISLIIFFMLSQSDNYQGSSPYVITWLLLVSNLIFSSSEFLKRDFEDGTIEQMLIICPNFEVFTLAKMLANYVIYALPIILTIPLLALFSTDIQNSLTNFIILAFLATIAINSITTFCGSLSLLENSAPIIAIIALPLIIPILLIASGGIDVENFEFSFKILLGLVILLSAITTLATAKIVKIIAE